MQFSAYASQNIQQVRQFFNQTFSDSESLEEGQLIGDLAYELLTATPAEDLYCFTAEENSRLIGCIIFSRLTFETGINAFLLAPVAIDTGYQGQGIGQKLIRFGLTQLQKDGIQLAATYGDPAFYSKVGFQPVSEKQLPPPLALSMPQGWLAQSLSTEALPEIRGQSQCVAAIAKPQFW